MNAKRFLSGFLLLALSSSVMASVPTCTPVIEKAWIRSAAPGSMMLAGYGIVNNACPQAITIKAVSSADFASAMMHETLIEGGISKMRHVAALPVAAHASVAFAPSGRHLMLMQPKHPLKEGDKVRLKLSLTDGREIAADFVVRKDAPGK
ncbi:MAG TPA: copper chaperone PCu(A)C [Arenimonas sp.]|uniref:copper chaperone PCu(A)C n=1 Tax=Arenimonas sp. TaxID=1872635 RepID=UPI002B8FD622|nr:copper chaperone PCu(A)C [Arenimonas sp.]HMB56061.1 copper chaperone PCu(A)C [Arenimonas sp.]